MDGRDDRTEAFAKLHALASDLSRSVRQTNHPLPDEFPTETLLSLANDLQKIAQFDGTEEKQTLLYAQAKLRGTRNHLKENHSDIERAHNALFAALDDLLEAVPLQQRVQLMPTGEKSLTVNREDFISGVVALERRIDLLQKSGSHTIVLVDQSKKEEFSLVKIDIDALIKNTATIKAELLSRWIDLGWITKLAERSIEITSSLKKNIQDISSLAGHFSDLPNALRQTRLLGHRVIQGTHILIRSIRRTFSRGTKPETSPLAAGTVFRDRDDVWCPEMVVIRAGEFVMGQDKAKTVDESWSHPARHVRVEREFALGKFPITFDQYDYYCEQAGVEKPSSEKWGRGQIPVLNVSWIEANVYCQWLSAATGHDYRLPSEAEWEYAARAGMATHFWWGDILDPKYGNFGPGKIDGPTPVGKYPANPLGLYDLYGNVAEWCFDVWHPDYEGAPGNAEPWITGGISGMRSARGFTWWVREERASGTSRGRFEEGSSNLSIGVRVARFL